MPIQKSLETDWIHYVVSTYGMFCAVLEEIQFLS